jgi:hypothetical protein
MPEIVAERDCPTVPAPSTGTVGQSATGTIKPGTASGTQPGRASLKALARIALERDKARDTGGTGAIPHLLVLSHLDSLPTRPAGQLLAAAMRGVAAVAAGPSDDIEAAEGEAIRAADGS